jgi:hypothetical protein
MAGDYGDYKEHTKYCNCIRYASTLNILSTCSESLDRCVVRFLTHEITDSIESSAEYSYSQDVFYVRSSERSRP